MKVSKYNTINDDNIKRRINIAIEIFEMFHFRNSVNCDNIKKY